MIIVKISGGLGNQMYQYAMMRRLQSRYPGTEIKGDASGYKLYDVHYGLELERVFGLRKKGYLKLVKPIEQLCAVGELPLLVGGALGKKIEVPQAWGNAKMRRLFTRIGRRNVIREGDDEVLARSRMDAIDTSKNWYLDGYWQNEIYFEGMLPGLRQEFAFSPLQTEINKKIADEMEGSESVSIHIRRGDYVASKFDILDAGYYHKAVEYICERVREPRYFVFSEDEIYADELLKWLPNRTIVSCNTGVDSFRDMQLMSLCKYNIVGNSSFSEWAGFLNSNENKIVVYPSQYTRDSKNTVKRERGWVKIDVFTT